MINIPNDTNSSKRTIADRIKSSACKIKSKLFLSEVSYLWLSFLIPVVIMYFIYLGLKIHPFGDGSVLVLDLNAQYVYFYEALREFVWGDQSLLYSFGRQLGGEFMGIYGYYLASPFSYIVALFPKEKILEALLSIFLLKTGLCGVTFGFYLHKTTPKEVRKRSSIIAFSIMYALCSYAVVHQSNSMWIDALIWLPILTYAIERLITKRRFKLYVIALAMTVMSNYYIGYMVCIYVALYFFYFYSSRSKDGQNNLIGEKTHFAKSLLRIIVYSIIALGISALIVLTSYYSLTFGKTSFSSPDWSIALRADIMDYLTKFLPGSYDTVRRLGLPFVFCGTLTLLMLPVYFISKKISAREKAISGIFIAIFMVSFMVNVVDLVWHGFQEPNWLNYRYSFMLSFFLLTLAYKGFDELEETSGKVHLATAGFITLFLIVAQKYVFPSYNFEEGAKLDLLQTVGFTLAMLAIYLLVLAFYKSTSNKQSIAIVLVFVVAFEMFANGIQNVAGFANDVVYSTYSSYNDFIGEIRPIVEDVQENDDSFYRMESIKHRYPNDNMALSIRGLSNSSSTLNRETVEVLRRFGYFSAYHKSLYLGGNPVSDSLFGIKYIVADGITEDELDEDEFSESKNTKLMLERYYELYGQNGNYKAYYNPYALSIAYGVSSDLLEYTISDSKGKDINLSPYINTNEVVSEMLGSGEVIEIFKSIDDVDVALSNCQSNVIDRHYKYYPKQSDSMAKVIYTFYAQTDGDVYFCIPSKYHRQIDISVNGNSYGTFYEDDTPRGFYLGYFEEGDKIKLEMKLVAGEAYVDTTTPMFYYLDRALFEDCLSELARTQVVIDDYTEDHLKGSVTTNTDTQTILTTIPYDEGWTVKVDGKKVDVQKSLDALLSFEIEGAGEHRVEFIYCSDAFIYGLFISLFFLALFAVVIIFEKPIYAFIYKKLYDEVGKEETDGKEKILYIDYTIDNTDNGD